jgi:hypothetical protein
VYWASKTAAAFHVSLDNSSRSLQPRSSVVATIRKSCVQQASETACGRLRWSVVLLTAFARATRCSGGDP